MAKAAKNDLVSLENLPISKEDVVAIAVVREEERLQKLQTETDKGLKQLKRNTEAKQAELQRLIDAAAGTKDRLDAVKKSLVELGFDVSNTTSTAMLNLDKINVQMNIQAKHGYGLSTTVTIDSTDAIRAVEAEIKTLFDSTQSVQETAIEVRKALGSLPSLERKARAHLAMKALDKSDDGRAIMASLSDLGTSGVLQLKQPS